MLVYPTSIQFKVGNKLHRLELAKYFYDNNLALVTYTESGEPNCTISTNPGFELDEGYFFIRDDELEYNIMKETVGALIDQGWIEKVIPEQKTQFGFVTATLYKFISRESE